MTITEFLEARIAEDEAEARIAAGCPSHDPDGQGYVTTVMEMEGSRKYGVIAVDPARVLAECAAKRAIVGTYSAVAANRNVEGSVQWHEERALLTSVRALAAVYKDHTDYLQDWQP